MVKSKMLSYSLMFFLALLSFFACSKKSDNPVGPTTPTNELKLTIGTQQITFNQGIGGYAIQENVSYVQFTKAEAGDTLFFILIFSGKQTGNQAWNPVNDTGVLLIEYGNSGITYLFPVQGSTNVTSYGNVGGAIAGTFTGVLEDNDQTQFNISGNFSVQRSADINSINNKRIIDIQESILKVEN